MRPFPVPADAERTARGRRCGPGTYFAAGFALACFGFFGVLAFLSTDASRTLPGWDGSMLRRAVLARDPVMRVSALAARRAAAHAAVAFRAGMTSVPIRSSCSRSSPFIR
jgi:hypothetical protein